MSHVLSHLSQVHSDGSQVHIVMMVAGVAVVVVAVVVVEEGVLHCHMWMTNMYLRILVLFREAGFGSQVLKELSLEGLRGISERTVA